MPKSSTFILTSGHEVYLNSLRLSYSYEGLIEGSPAKYTDRAREEGLQAHLKKDLRIPRELPFLALDPGISPLPDWQWLGLFRSLTPVKKKGADYSSQLYVCWFSAELPQDLPAFIEEALSQVKWKRQAKDYDIMDEM